jgi:single-stranded DNA-binding protein
MVGINLVVLSGNVGSVNQGKTGLNVTAFSMLLAVDSRNGETLWIRVNVYGTLAKKCSDKIEKGNYVVVVGEFMERKKSDSEATFIEVRAKEVIFGGTIGKEVGRILDSVEDVSGKTD